MNNNNYLNFSTDSGAMSVREILTILFLRKKIIFGVFTGIICISAFLAFYLLSPKYEASATIIINHNALTNPLADAPPESDFEKLTDFHTQKDLIVSKTIATPVVEQLDLEHTRTISNTENILIQISKLRQMIGELINIESWKKPRNNKAESINYLIKNIQAKSKPESKSIDISYVAYHPDETLKTLDGVINEYISLYFKLIKSRASGVSQFLEIKLAESEQKLREAENKLLEFRKKDTVILNDKKNSNIGFIGITDSTEVQDEFKLYVLNMEEELRKLTSEYAPNHPTVVALRKKINNFMAVLNAIPDKEIELHRLKRAIETRQDLVLELKRNLNRAHIVQSGMLNKMNLITVVSKPSVNQTPVSPKRKLIMFLAIFGGILLGIFTGLIKHYLDHSLYTPRDIQVFLKLKTLGSLRKI